MTTTLKSRIHWATPDLLEPRPIVWAVDHLIPERSLVVLFGPAGVGKTFLCLHLAASVAMGVPWLGRSVRQGPALFIDEESGRSRLERRIGQVMRGLGADGGVSLPLAYTCVEGFTFSRNHGVADVLQIIAAVKPVVVVIDSLSATSEGDENTVRDMRSVMTGLRWLLEEGDCSIIVIHHTDKRGENYRGSSVIEGQADVMLQVSRSSGALRLVTKKSRDAEPTALTALPRWGEDGSYTLALDASPRSLSSNEAALLDYFRRCHESDIASAVAHLTGKGIGEPAARRCLYRLVEKGLLRRSDSGGAGEKAHYVLVVEE